MGGGLFLTVYAVHVVSVQKSAALRRERFSRLRIGGQGGEFLARRGAAERQNRLEVRVLALQLGEGG